MMWTINPNTIGNFPIRLAVDQDLTKVIELYRSVTNDLVTRDLQQWHTAYPSPGIIQSDIANHFLFVWEPDEITGVIVLDRNQDPQYDNIDWQIVSDQVLVIHRLAVHPAFQRQGIARQLCLFAERLARENGVEVIRLDAYRGNEGTHQFYHSLGYQQTTGWVQFPYQDQPCDCWEKRVT